MHLQNPLIKYLFSVFKVYRLSLTARSEFDLPGSTQLTDIKTHQPEALSLTTHQSFLFFLGPSVLLLLLVTPQDQRKKVPPLWSRQSTDWFLLKVIIKFIGLRRRLSP